VYSPVLSVPAPAAAARVAEADPRYARTWLSIVSQGDGTEAARELYQALYTLNRVAVRAPARMELMALYDRALATIAQRLPPQDAGPPLAAHKRRFAEFARRLHVEMAYGYKCCLRDLSRARLSLGRKTRSAACIGRTLHHLTEVLLRSYAAYLPYPAGVWREIHELYRLAEKLDAADAPQQIPEEGAPRPATIREGYLQALLLGLADPYQLPQQSVPQLRALLSRESGRARLLAPGARPAPRESRAWFVIDPTADAPPFPFARGFRELPAGARFLDTSALLELLQERAASLQRGEPMGPEAPGFDCPGDAGLDLIRRLIRAWGEAARRRYARQQRSGGLHVCIGLDALHFVAAGERTFHAFLEICREPLPAPAVDAGVDFVELDGAGDLRDAAALPEPRDAPVSRDRWRVRDASPQGMAIACHGGVQTSMRVGELIGVRYATDHARWQPAVVRWLKTPEPGSVEAGLELLAADMTAAAARFADGQRDVTCPVLRLPANDVVPRPATLLLPRGAVPVGAELELLEEDAAPRRVRLLRLIERTGSFEQMVYGESAKNSRRGR